MENSKAIGILQAVKAGTADIFISKAAINDALDMAIAALEQQEQDRWTPVAENPKKPKYQFDTYLVYTKYERFGVADFFADGRWIGYDIDGDQIDGDEITAWRPLPAPYQEDKA